MVSLVGYKALFPNTLAFLQTMHARIFAALNEECGTQKLDALIRSCIESTGTFNRDYLSLLLKVQEGISTLVGVYVPDDQQRTYEALREEMNEALGTFARNAGGLPFTKFIKSDAIAVQAYWQEESGICSDPVSRKINYSLLRDCRSSDFALGEKPNGEFAVYMTYAGRVRTNDTGVKSRECFALNISDILDAGNGGKPNPYESSGMTRSLVVHSNRLLASILKMNSFAKALGIDLIDGEYERAESRKTSGAQIRTTDELKYPIGLFG